MSVERKKELRRRRRRKSKLKKLKNRLVEARDMKTKEAIIEKIKRIQTGYIPPD
jgi:hypothetical protein